MSLPILWFVLLATSGAASCSSRASTSAWACCTVRRHERRRAARRDQHDRAGVGRQRGLADRRRRRHVRRLPRVVCDDVLGLLPGARGCARGADHPRRVVRVPRAARQRRWRWTWSATLTLGSVLVPLLVGCALGNLLRGVPIDSSHEYTGTLLHTAQPLRSVRRGHPRAALPGARRRLPGAQDQGRRAVPGGGHGALARAARRARRDRLHGLDAGDRRPRGARRGAGRGDTRHRRRRWFIRAHRDGWAFLSTAVAMLATVATIFVFLYPRVMVSSTSAAYSLTVRNASRRRTRSRS